MCLLLLTLLTDTLLVTCALFVHLCLPKVTRSLRFATESGVQWPDLCRLAEFPAQSVSRLLSASASTGNLLVLHLYLLQRREAAAEPAPLAAAAAGWIAELTALRSVDVGVDGSFII